MSGLKQDLRSGLRAIRTRPAVLFGSVLALTIGIGASTAIFSVSSAVLLRPLPFTEADRLHLLHTLRQNDGRTTGVSYQDFLDWSAAESFDALAAFFATPVQLTGGERPIQVNGAVVTTEFFRILQTTATIGRVFRQQDAAPEMGRIAILGDGLWRTHFGADPDVVGSSIVVDGAPVTVLGVLPPGFRFPYLLRDAEVFVAAEPDADGEPQQDRGARFFRVIGRLATGATANSAQQEMESIAAALEELHPDTNSARSVRIVALADEVVGELRGSLLALVGAVALLLAVACANVANLMLASTATRHQELAIRSALGASRWRVARLLLAQSVLLAMIGTVGGVLFAYWGVHILVSSVAFNVPQLTSSQLNTEGLLFAVALGTATSVIFGLLPALRGSTPRLATALGFLAPQPSRHDGARLRTALVVSQTAVAVTLVISAGLLFQSLRALRAVELGFDSNNVVTAEITLPFARFGVGPETRAFFDKVVASISALPGVESVAAISNTPLSGANFRTTVGFAGRPAPEPGQEAWTVYRQVTPGYFRTMRIPLLIGRDVTNADSATSAGVVVVNEAFAKEHFPGESPVGQRISVGMRLEPSEPELREIVGVASDVRFASPRSEAGPEIYIPHAQQSWFAMTLVIRTLLPLTEMAGAIAEKVMEFDPEQPVGAIRPMATVVADETASEQMYTAIWAVFSAHCCWR